MDNLKQYNQWVLWYPEAQADGSVKKFPATPDGQRWDAHDSRIHLPFDAACAAAAHLGAPYQVGFAFTEHDPFFFVDIDNCVDDKGNWTSNAVDIMQRLPGAAVMLSQSGRGLHIVGSMAPYPGDRKKKPDDKTFDGLYTEKRFIACTFNQLAGNASTDLTMQAHTLIAERLPPKSKGNRPDWSDQPIEGYTVALDDAELIEKALKSRSTAGAFGGVSFAALWHADGAILGQRWPDYGGQGREFDHTSADAALAAHLAWWTGHNPERIERLMRQSALMRDKWDARPEYLAETIIGACASVTGFYNPGAHKEQKQAEIQATLGPQVDPYCDVLEQMQIFRGHVYVHDRHCVFTPDGILHKPEQYRAMYGGRTYAMDRDGTKTTRNAWEALTESVDLRCPRVASTVFRPKLQPGLILEQCGRYYVNSYVPPKIHIEQGDVAPFIDHVSHLIPDAGDRDILLDYMAAIVQLPGEKFQWCPVIQGISGNGKTLLYEVLEYTVGDLYSHKIAANDLDNKFNGWIADKVLGCVEEIRIAGDRQKAEFMKEMITNRRMPVQGKRKDQITGDNCMNFIMFSNHKDAVLKTADDRRYCVFYTAQQEMTDLKPDSHYNWLYKWLEQGGFAYVAYYLHTRQVNVNVLGRAPMTTSTQEAFKASLGVAEQIVLENVEMGTPGFRGDIISSAAVTYALAGAGKKMGPKAVSHLLKDLGYVRHNGTYCINNERFRAYVPSGTILAQAPQSTIRDRYIAANTNSVD